MSLYHAVVNQTFQKTHYKVSQLYIYPV